MDKVAENLITGLTGLATGYIIAEGYKQLISTSAKKSWERDVGIHHGEAGIALFGAGSTSSIFFSGKENQKALNASLFTAGVGIGLLFMIVKMCINGLNLSSEVFLYFA